MRIYIYIYAFIYKIMCIYNILLGKRQQSPSCFCYWVTYALVPSLFLLRMHGIVWNVSFMFDFLRSHHICQSHVCPPTVMFGADCLGFSQFRPKKALNLAFQGTHSWIWIPKTLQSAMAFWGSSAFTMWGPPVISWFINPSNYSYKYHKP